MKKTLGYTNIILKMLGVKLNEQIRIFDKQGLDVVPATSFYIDDQLVIRFAQSNFISENQFLGYKVTILDVIRGKYNINNVFNQNHHYIDRLFKELDIEPYDIFYLKKNGAFLPKVKYNITPNFTLCVRNEWDRKGWDFEKNQGTEFLNINDGMLIDILNGKLEISKYDESDTAIAAMLFKMGLRYVARDIDGTLNGFHQKPQRINFRWIIDEKAYLSIPIGNIFFPKLTWRDNPIDLGKIVETIII